MKKSLLLILFCSFYVSIAGYSQNATDRTVKYVSSSNNIFLCQMDTQVHEPISNNRDSHSWINLKNFLILTGILIVGLIITCILPVFGIVELAGLILWIYMGVILIFAMPWLKILFWIGLVFLFLCISPATGAAISYTADSISTGIVIAVIGFILSAFFCLVAFAENEVWYVYYIIVIVGHLVAALIYGIIYVLFIVPIRFLSKKTRISRMAERMVFDSHYLEKCSRTDRQFYLNYKLAIDKIVSEKRQIENEIQRQEQNRERTKQMEQLEVASKLQENEARLDDENAKLKRHLNSLPERIRLIGKIEKSDTNDDFLTIFDQLESILRDIHRLKTHLIDDDRFFIKKQKQYFEAELEDAKDKYIESKVFTLHRESILELFLSLENT